MLCRLLIVGYSRRSLIRASRNVNRQPMSVSRLFREFSHGATSFRSVFASGIRRPSQSDSGLYPGSKFSRVSDFFKWNKIQRDVFRSTKDPVKCRSTYFFTNFWLIIFGGYNTHMYCEIWNLYYKICHYCSMPTDRLRSIIPMFGGGTRYVDTLDRSVITAAMWGPRLDLN